MAEEQQTNQIPERVPLGRRFPPTIPQQTLPTPTATTTTEYIAPDSPTHTGSPSQRQSQSIPTATTPPNSRTQQQSSANNDNNNSNNNNNSSNSSNNKNARPTKRQKVSLACQECRDRKIKCDGERPICGPCIKKKRPEGSCVYEPERGRRGVKSQYVQLLENKVRELENAMRFEQGNDRSPSITPIDRPPEFAPRVRIIPPDSRGENHGGDNDNRQGYFGSSSAMSFMREVREVIGKKTTLSPDENRSYGSPSRRLSQSQIRSYSVCHDYVLPPRKVADSLVRSYWTFVHTLYPFLHKPGFMRTYSKLWDHESEGDPLFHCILNLVFALGCQLSPDIGESEREPTSDVFFQRSKKLLHFDILDEGNIKVVQALLLMGQYLQCTKMPGRCWIVVGLATRVAQGLGLHRDGHNINNGRHKTHGNGCTRQLERELRKRLWGGCLVLDRVISMAYGRPFMIPVTQNLILPEAIDDELLTSYPDPPAKQPEDKPTRMAFFVHTLQLYEIMGDILTTLYSTGTRRTNEEASIVSDEQLRAGNISSVIRLEMALNTWEKALPWFLRLGIYTQDSANSPRNRRSMTDNILLRQNNVLRARYLHTCILLYRPVFAHFFALEESNHVVSQDTGLQRSVFLQSSITCVSSAQELVEMIHRNIKELLPAWWYNMFYLYTSATVLLMARLFPKIKQAIGEDYLTESWDKCLSCLSRYQSYSESAKWCFESLSELNKIAFQSNDGKNNNIHLFICLNFLRT
ncbi:fungal-specific transcription factor domain-containing protein [Circinella umbellata]|nr:fungal-specific transcription factor domain-containing protein [Circinella umbellata]